jgi:hypothetical protein
MLTDISDLPVNGNDLNFLLFLQYVIEGVRGENQRKGEFAIDDLSLMDSCPARGESLVY